CDDETVGITDYEDIDQEDGELPDLSTFSATNVFASICEHFKEDIDISITNENEEVHMEDVQMDDEVKREFTTPHRYKFLTSYALPVAYLHPHGKHVKSELVGYHVDDDDDGMICDDGCCSREQTWSMA
ncbi:hypothetical protein Tco_1567173, partial [Tanacetum coccineum]